MFAVCSVCLVLVKTVIDSSWAALNNVGTRTSMPQFRTIAAMLALSALLLAGWTNATHFHAGGVHIGATHQHSAMVRGHSDSVGGDCFISSCPESAGGELVSTCGATQTSCCSAADTSDASALHSPEQAANGLTVCASGHATHEHGGCLICDFLSGQSDGLSVSFEFAGMLAAGLALPELLHASPARTLYGFCCRGPPATA